MNREHLDYETLGQAYGDFFGPHEFHVTVSASTSDPERFSEVCSELDVKAHKIYNELPAGTTMLDYLTGSESECTSAEAFLELGRITSGLRSAGLNVVREKIETTPWHPKAPRTRSTQPQVGTYFESHFTLPDLPMIHGERLLQWRDMPLYISTTDNKRSQGRLFATLRNYDSTSEEFTTAIENLHTALARQLEVARPTVEYALFDSNPNHDKIWVESYQSV